MKALLYSLAALAAVGLLLSSASHVAAIQGRPGPLGDLTWTLHMGVFVALVPVLLVARGMEGWKTLYRGCPAWMRYAVYVLVGYAAVNFCIFVAMPPQGGAGRMPPAVVRGFSGHWMALYAVGFAMLYSAGKGRAERPWRDTSR